MHAVKVVLIYTIMQMLLGCLYLQTQLLFYIEEQRRRTARRSAVFLLLSLPRRTLPANVAADGFGSDQGESLSGGKTLRKKLSSRTNGMRTSECRAHHYCLFRSYCILP